MWRRGISTHQIRSLVAYQEKKWKKTAKRRCLSQSLAEEPQIQRSLVCSRDFFLKKLPLTSGFQTKNRRSTRKWLHNAGLMIWSLIRRITIQHNNDPRQCRNQRDSFFFYFVPAMRNMSNQNGAAGGQFTSSLRPCCHSDSACFSNTHLLYFKPKQWIMYALCTHLERQLSPYHVLWHVHGNHRN